MSETERVNCTRDYDQARERVANTPSLAPYEDVLLDDWGDPAFWCWVAMADIEAIIDWAIDWDAG